MVLNAPRGKALFDARGRRARGVTLIELAIVIAILSLLAGMAIPRLISVVRRQRLEQASRRVASDIRLVRSQAIRDKTEYGIIFLPVQQEYQVFASGGGPGGGGSGDSDEYTVKLDTYPYEGVRLTSTNFGGAAPQKLEFNYLGLPNDGGTVVLSNGLEEAVLTVSPTTGLVTRTIQITSVE